MTERQDLDLAIGEWLRVAAARRAPRHTLEATLARTRTSRPQPAWRAMVLVPQMRLGSRVLVGSPTVRRLVAAAGLVLVALAMVVTIVGAVLLADRLNRRQLFVYAANPASLSPEVCSEVGDCRAALAGWPGGRFLVEQPADSPRRPSWAVAAPWPSTIVALEVSPTGSHVAYLRTQSGFPTSCSQLVVLDRQTGVERVVADDWGASAGWWLGKNRLAFAAGGRCSPGGDGIFGYDPTTDRLELLVRFSDVGGLGAGASVTVHAWHPDGRRILLTDGSSPGGPLIVSLDGTGPTVERVACDCSASGGSWSPDGRRLLLEMDHGDLAIANDDGSGLRLVSSGGWASWATWSPSAESIVFERSQPKAEGPRDRPDYDILVVSPDGGEPRFVGVARGRGGILGATPRWSPDGEWIYWSDLDGTWSVRPDGMDLRRLPLPAQIDVRWVEVEGR